MKTEGEEGCSKNFSFPITTDGKELNGWKKEFLESTLGSREIHC